MFQTMCISKGLDLLPFSMHRTEFVKQILSEGSHVANVGSFMSFCVSYTDIVLMQYNWPRAFYK